ncbi:gamma subclass chorismate mutase AroQ [Pseudomonas sp. SMV7]|uniref:gamma subclass chorismate mutase AroQ n=1 Tax=Pseudomonas sp. SMV7 TaxID=3390194 RepID=UPI003F849E7C
MRKFIPAVLTLSAFLVGCSNQPGAVQSQVLHRATGSWDGKPYTHYPDGQPVLSLVKVSIPPNTTLDWHCHQALNLGYLKEGELEVETRGGKRTTLTAGNTLAELVGEVHRGRTTRQAATVMVFHAANEELAFSTPQDQCPGQRPPADGPLDILLDDIEHRLASAESVALHKWDKAQPVQDNKRELQILNDVRNNAWRYQLPAERAAAFFADQIEAHKMMQYSLLNRWHSQGRSPDTSRRDLQQELRPELDALQARLLQHLASLPSDTGSACNQRLASSINERGLSPLMKQAMVRATGQLCDQR